MSAYVAATPNPWQVCEAPFTPLIVNSRKRLIGSAKRVLTASRSGLGTTMMFYLLSMAQSRWPPGQSRFLLKYLHESALEQWSTGARKWTLKEVRGRFAWLCRSVPNP